MPAIQYKKQSHCVYHCLYHIIFGTKYRRKILNDGIFAYMEKLLLELKEHYPELEIMKINHGQDHLHIMMWVPPKWPVAKAVQLLKANAARGLKQKFPFLKQVYWGTESIWSEGYFVSTVGVNEDVIRKYIEKQGEEDAGRAQLELL